MAEQGNFLLYTAGRSAVTIEVYFKDETVWLTQKALAKLFDVDRTVITKHLRNIFKEGELAENSVCANFAHTAADGKTYQTRYYNQPGRHHRSRLQGQPSVVRAMALSGCTGVFVGFESLNGGNLTDSRKRTPAPEDYARRVDLFHRYGIQVNGSFVLGFDHDRPDVFERTVAWIEANRLECATFHILTPYPGTPLFRQLEAEGRILHRDWDRYDTGHVVFAPKHMSAEQLDRGYAWCYSELFSHRSIWKRRPSDYRAVPAYLAMSYLYKRSNRFWHLLIRHRLTGAVWRPLIELSRRRHLRLRRELQAIDVPESCGDARPRASQVLTSSPP